MHLLRFAPISSLAFLVLALGLPSNAAAAAPNLGSPAAAATATEGGSMSFAWNGALQGDVDTLDRAFFRLEVIKAANMPSGAQAEWPPSTLENSAQTVPGAAENTLSTGVPMAGEYRWRVCAWGVVDDEVANEIVQLPSGCSTSRAFTTVAASSTSGGIDELKIEEQTKVAGDTRTVYVEREEPQGIQEASPTPAQEVVEEVEEIVETTFTKIAPTTVERGQGSAISGIGGSDSGSDGGEGGANSDDPFASDQAAERKGVGGAVVTGLSSSLPFVPIPFWTLALLLACFPLAIFWRRSVLGMFEWSDGSIDGRGGLDDLIADLAFVPLDPEVKIGSTTADGTAAAPAPIAPSVPDRGRRAA